MNTLHLISHTHWDREWHQTFQQFRLKLVHLVDGLLDILDSDPDFRYFMLDGQTIVLDDYLQIRPERESDLRRYIQSGRVLIGPWYILPDEFLVSPEATIRNLWEGERGARRFGAKMRIGYIPDPFGHIGQMPQILQGFGIQNACLWRGLGDMPNEFWWSAPDGTRVLMGFLQQGYMNAASVLNLNLDGFVNNVRHLRDQLAAHTHGTELLLMHGMDHQEANPATSAALAYAEGKLGGDRVIHSTLPLYFEQVRATMDLNSLPEVKGELRCSKNAPLLPGVLSARMWIKQRNQACETLLEKWAEPFSAWAQIYAEESISREKLETVERLRNPQDVLREAWRILMQCHPHDSICGCSIDQVHDEMRPRFDQVEQIGEEITSQSLKALSGIIDTRAGEALNPAQISSAVVVFNPTSHQRSDVVEVELNVLPESGNYELVDETGAVLPFQTVGMGNGVLYDMLMDRTTFRTTAGSLSPGAGPAGMRIVDLKVFHETAPSPAEPPGEVRVEVKISPAGEPDLAAWELSRQQLIPLMEDPRIKNYHILVKGDPTSKVRIAAKDVPGLGYRTFWVRAKEPVVPKPAQMNAVVRTMMPLATRLAGSPAIQRLIPMLVPDPAARPPFVLENEFFKVQTQPDGSVDVFDKNSGVLYRGQNRFEDGGDRGDTYNFSKPDVDTLVTARLKSARVERGPVMQLLEMHLELEIPEGLSADRKARSKKAVHVPVTSRVMLITGVGRVEFHTTIVNSAHDHRLRAHFAAPFAVSAADSDGHFEIVRRSTVLPEIDASWVERPRPEVPQRAFTAISDGKTGLLVANRGLPEVQVLQRSDGNSEVALTLLRCVGWLSRGDFPERNGPAGPEIETPGAQMIGQWSFDYAVVPFVESWRDRAVMQAAAFESPLRGWGTILHEGKIPASGSFIQLEPAEFNLSAVKITEDGMGWLVRGYNSNEKDMMVNLKTLLPVGIASRANLAEEKREELPVMAKNTIRFPVRGHEIATVRINRP